MANLISENSGISEQARSDEHFWEGYKLLVEHEYVVAKLLNANIDKLEREPTWGYLNGMYDRALRHVIACFVLLSHGHYSSAEALCRTAFEATINLYFASLGDVERNIASYFLDYVSTEREQNRKWLASVNASTHTEEYKIHHRQRIEQKEITLNTYEKFIHGVFEEHTQGANRWPSIFDRFKIIGKEVEYRTVYASLCSQAHNDAEDLLNDVISCVSTEFEARQRNENIRFAVFMSVLTVSALTEAAAIYIAKYHIDTVQALSPIIQKTMKLADKTISRQI